MASPTRSDGLISAVIVHYRTPRLLEAAVAALRADARADGLTLEIIVVDNSGRGTPAEDRLDPARVKAHVHQPGSNLGYAAGLNFGVERAGGSVLLLMNADVAVQRGALLALLRALGGAGIAGPRLFWDRGCQLLLPPQLPRTRRAELDALAAERFPAWGRSFRRRWRRRARTFWKAEEPLVCHELTGAFLAVTREAWERVGPFDEGYRLYFEETEWLLRARDAGVRAVLAPAARAVHAYDQSAKREPRAQSWFEESAERFRRRRYEAWFAVLLRLLERLPRRFEELPPASTEVAPRADEPGDAPGQGPAEELWAEVTPLPLGVPAAGCPVAPEHAADFEIPPEVLAGARSSLRLSVTDAAGRDLWSRIAPPVAVDE